MGIDGRYKNTALTALFSPISPSSWFTDSSASNLMTSVEQNLNDTYPYTRHEQIIAANGQHLSIARIGSLDIPTSTLIHLFHFLILFCPLSTNLISVGQLVDQQIQVHQII